MRYALDPGSTVQDDEEERSPQVRCSRWGQVTKGKVHPDGVKSTLDSTLRRWLAAHEVGLSQALHLGQGRH
jgi:hypothetical protein